MQTPVCTLVEMLSVSVLCVGSRWAFYQLLNLPALLVCRNTFEVFIDDKPVFSKLVSGKYPLLESLVEVRTVTTGDLPDKSTDHLLLKKTRGTYCAVSPTVHAPGRQCVVTVQVVTGAPTLLCVGKCRACPTTPCWASSPTE